MGMGTWCLGDHQATRETEIDALRAGIDAGIKMIDTAEMYGEGKSEELVGQAIRGYKRDDLFLVSKVYPHNAGKKNIFHSVEQSIKRLGTDYLDARVIIGPS
jgi:aryl-alcohol dehydrogenase-like predicted oxidoreductase